MLLMNRAETLYSNTIYTRFRDIVNDYGTDGLQIRRQPVGILFKCFSVAFSLAKVESNIDRSMVAVE